MATAAHSRGSSAQPAVALHLQRHRQGSSLRGLGEMTFSL